MTFYEQVNQIVSESFAFLFNIGNYFQVRFVVPVFIDLFVIILVPYLYCFTHELFEIQIVHCMLPSGKFYEKLVCLGGCWHGASMPAIFNIDWTARWCDQRPVKLLKLSLKRNKNTYVPQ